jgi:hypothetical protein
MKHISWRWILPLVQILVALAGLVYGPHQFKAKALRDGASGDNNMLEYNGQNFPAPVERVSKSINFPALVLSYPFNKYNVNELLFVSNNYTFVTVYPSDVAFFCAIVVFWYWVGRTMDRSQARNTISTRSHWKRLASLACGVVFSILMGTYALHMVTSRWRPERQIGMSGMIWAVALLVYFVWRLKRESATAP